MSEQHTPTPWGFSIDDENGVEFNITSENWYVAVCCDEPGNGTPHANARRIVAAVNACAGYTTEELEQATLDKRHRHEIIADLVKSNKQHDQLLASIRVAAEQILRCDYTLARCTLLQSIDSMKANT